MKSNTFKFTFRYTSMIILITTIIVILNYGGFIYFARYSPYIKEPTKTVKSVAQELTENNNQLSSKTIEMIKNNGIWVQLLNNKGEVIYNYNKPEDIGNFYTINDIAIMSKSYLKDYPIFLWTSKENLVILGYPKNSIDKYNLIIPSNGKSSVPTVYIYIVILNIVILTILSIILNRVLNKPLNRLIKGIFSLKSEEETYLNEKGIYKDLSNSINEISKIILDKNHKIKLRNNAIESWITSISHDVRTPLSMILGYAAMIEEDNSLPEEVRSEAKIITQNSLRLRELITNLNLATSLQYNMQPLNLSTVKLSTIICEAVTSCKKSGILRSCNIEVIIENDDITVMVDRDLILRALINIITNSVKHNKEGCSIKVIVSKESVNNKYASIVISDNGSGISKDIIDRINGGVDYHTTMNQKHGLGLIIVRNIMDVHCGKLIIENGIEQGINVILRIPKEG